MPWDEDLHPRDTDGRFATAAALKGPRTAKRPASPLRVWADDQRAPAEPAPIPAERRDYLRQLAENSDRKEHRAKVFEEVNDLPDHERDHFERERELVRGARVQNYADLITRLGGTKADNPDHPTVSAILEHLDGHYSSVILYNIHDELQRRRTRDYYQQLRDTQKAELKETKKGLKEWVKSPVSATPLIDQSPGIRPSPSEALKLREQLQGLTELGKYAGGTGMHSAMKPEDQKAVRQHFASVVEKMGFKIVNASGKHELMRLVKVEEMDGIAGNHAWEGTVRLSTKTTNGLIEGMRQIAHGEPLTRDTLHAVKTMLHEEIHGTGPAARASYKREGVVLEEATTELAARVAVAHYTPTLSEHKNKGATPDGVPHAPHEATRWHAAGVYQHHIDALTSAADRATDGMRAYNFDAFRTMGGDHLVHKLVTEAALEYRSAPHGLAKTSKDTMAVYQTAMERASLKFIPDEAMRKAFLTAHEKQLKVTVKDAMKLNAARKRKFRIGG